MAIKGLKKKTARAGKKQIVTFSVDCSAPTEDHILDPAGLEKFFVDRIKVDGKTGNLGEKIEVKRSGSTILINAELPFSKKYLKYLSKKYLKKQQLRDFLRVIAKRSDKHCYELKYFNIQAEDDQEE